MAPDSQSKVIVSLLLLVVLALGAFVRFHEIDRRGPVFFDEGIYTLEGRWIYTASSSLWSAFLRKLEEARSHRNLYAFEEEAERVRNGIKGEPPVWGRPAFSLMTAISMAILGPGKLYAANAVSAFLGTLSILLLFLLGRRMVSTGAALAAAFLLAISGYHYAYAVSGLADVSALCVSLLSFLLYRRSLHADDAAGPEEHLRLGWTVLAGLSAGFAFTVHDRYLYGLLVLFLHEGVDLIRRNRTFRGSLKRLFAMGSSFLFPLFLFELPYYLAMVFLRRHQHALPFRTYFEELFTHHVFNLLDAFALPLLQLPDLPELREAGSHFYNFLTYPYLFFRFEGVVFPLLFLVGLGLTIRRRRRTDALLLLWIFVPLLLFSLGLSTSIRYGLVFLPAVMIVAGRGLIRVSRWIGGLPVARRLPPSSIVTILLLAAGLSNFAATRQTRALRCSYDEPARFLREHGSKHISLQFPVSRVYLGVENVKEPPYGWDMLKEAYRQGYRYFLVDFRENFLRPPFDTTGRWEVIDAIERRLEPVFTCVQPCYSAPCYLFEVNPFFLLTLKIVREAHQRGLDVIRIYDLEPLLGAGTSPTSPSAPGPSAAASSARLASTGRGERAAPRFRAHTGTRASSGRSRDGR